MLDLLQTSLRDPAVYDELSPDGVQVRPHWANFLESLKRIGSAELSKRWERAERRIRENGVTYNVYGDPLGKNHPWHIDLIPLLISAREWRFIEAGIVQRAQLLNQVLADLYGPQRLLKEGLLPAPLLYANPAFLRPLAGLSIPNANYLHIVAVDLARSPDGQWWVLADRTQAPSGAGYALENRTIVADVLPDLFRTCNVQRLATFFRAQREALYQMAGVDQPRIVLLTPGPYNETYFEHSYLARYLGFPLVEGGNLTVRNRRVFLKTVEGLQEVHVILRRVDDSFCDPLELRSDSFLGVAGLVDAVAAGNVKIANALGSGVIETAAIIPFLPNVARHILGEDLKLPSVATWWCGENYALDWVLDHLDHVVVKPAFPVRGMEPVFGAELAKAEKQQLAQQLQARPYEYVAQEQVQLSTAPIWDRGSLFSRAVVLRTYVLNTGSKWIALPGGLVRVAGADGPIVSMQRGGHSKDGWVIGEGPVDTVTLLRPRDQPVELRRAPADLPSRTADNLFWLGRYTERSECTARLLRELISRVRRADRSELGAMLRLHHCLDSDHSKLPPKRPPTAEEFENELISLLTDTKRPDSLPAALADVYRVGSAVRERLSADMTRLIGQLTEAVEVESYVPFVEYSAVLNGCLEMLSAFSGLERENITRGVGWLFMSIGRRLERAMYLCAQVREILEPLSESEWPLLEFLLAVADSSMTYRSRYYTTLQPIAVLDVLMADSTNPRSLDFQIGHLADLYSKLPRNVPSDLQAMRHAHALLQSFELQTLNYNLPGAPKRADLQEERVRLTRFLKDLQELLPSWADNLANNYFSHARTLPISIGE